MELITQTKKGNSMNRDEAINQLGFVVVTEWADGKVRTATYQNEVGAIKAVERENSIEGVSSFAYRLTVGEVIA